MVSFFPPRFCRPCPMCVLLLHAFPPKKVTRPWLHLARTPCSWKDPRGDVPSLVNNYNNTAVTFQRRRLMWSTTHRVTYLPNGDPAAEYTHLGTCAFVCRQVTDARKSSRGFLPAFSSCSDWCCFLGLLHVFDINTEWYCMAFLPRVCGTVISNVLCWVFLFQFSSYELVLCLHCVFSSFLSSQGKYHQSSFLVQCMEDWLSTDLPWDGQIHTVCYVRNLGLDLLTWTECLGPKYF